MILSNEIPENSTVGPARGGAERTSVSLDRARARARLRARHPHGLPPGGCRAAPGDEGFVLRDGEADLPAR